MNTLQPPRMLPVSHKLPMRQRLAPRASLLRPGVPVHGFLLLPHESELQARARRAAQRAVERVRP